jgi:glycosyltransferase involved in cell wall biosynthesis
MKITLNLRALQPRYGFARYAENLILHLAKIDHENEYTVYVRTEGFPELDDLGPNFRVRRARAHPALRIPWEQVVLPLHLLRQRVSVFHDLGFGTSVLRVCPKVITIADMTIFRMPHVFERPRRLFFQTILPVMLRAADVVVAISESAKRDILEIVGIPEKKIKVIYLGRDERFRPVQDERRLAEVRARYGLDRKVILFVGIIQARRKNVVGLVEAYARLADLRKQYCLVIAGGDPAACPELDPILARDGLAEDVFCLGFVPDEDLPALYSLADLFVYPSFYEGFGLTVLEAMSCGVPVVASNAASIPEVVGDAGILVDPARTDEISHAIQRVLSDSALRADLAQASLRRAECFSWTRTARETLEVYRTLGA